MYRNKERLTEKSSDRQKVSVILTVLNESASIKTILENLLSQSRMPDEIVIVDGGSKDGTIELIKKFSKKDSSIKLSIAKGANISQGRNIAIRQAKYPIIAVTDGGCRPDRNWLRCLVQPLLDDETFGAVAGVFEVDWRNHFEFLSGLLCMPKDSGDPRTRMFYGRSSAFCKNVWEAAGGYPEWLYTAEDTLFALRVLQLGYRVAYAKDSIVAWRPRPTLRKLTKMFFLYGRGNGRIDRGNIKGTIYWLRYHFLWSATLLFGIVFPWLWIATFATLAYLYVRMILPVLKKVRKKTNHLSREFYVPLIVLMRNLSTNVGYLLGRCEYRCIPTYREKLEAYFSGQSKSE